jgi:hypothetical protein
VFRRLYAGLRGRVTVGRDGTAGGTVPDSFQAFKPMIMSPSGAADKGGYRRELFSVPRDGPSKGGFGRPFLAAIYPA